MTSNEETAISADKARSEEAFALTAALLRQDRFLLPVLLLALGLPSAIQVYLLELPEWIFVSAVVVERLAQMAVLFGVARRWKRKVSQPGARISATGRAFLRTFAFGTVLWFLCIAPLVLSSVNPESNLILAAAFLFIFGLMLSLRFYFYFAPTALLGMDLKSSVAAALEITKANPRAAVRSALAPLGLTMVLINACSLPFPDGRSLEWAALGAFCQSAFWLLATYSALAFALTLVDDASWRAAGLDPYRSERLETLKVQGRGTLADLLSARSGMQAMVLAVLLFISNSLRDYNEPPAAAISLKSVEYADSVAKVSVKVSDPEYKLRGFLPLMFSIATRDGTPFSRQPTAIANGEPSGAAPSSSRGSRTDAVINLEFATNRTAETLKTQADLWLWYKGTPVVLLNAAPEPASSLPQQ